jgi:hypothetical protein
VRALLDEQVPTDLASLITDAGPHHEVSTVGGEGWKGLKNGALLQRMRESGFEALVTIDRRMEHQQNIPRSGIGLVVLHAYRARIRELAPLAPAIAAALDTLQPGAVVHLHAPPAK